MPISAESLINKYRPQKWEEVIGQDALVKSLRNAVVTNAAHTFLLVGPSGCGKTTLARIAAKEFGSKYPVEINAAKFTSIDDMRDLTDKLNYRPLDNEPCRSFIVDEFHALSRQAVQSILKAIEEPPEWCRWFLCTTEGAKIIETIRTRSAIYNVKPVPVNKLFDLLCDVAEAENFEVDEQVIDLCAKEANGSPRQALSNLAVCSTANDRAQAATLLQSATDVPEAIELARALYRGCTWDEAQGILNKLQDHNPDSIRIMICRYFTKVALSSKKESVIQNAWSILDAFSKECRPQDGLAPIVLAVATLVK